MHEHQSLSHADQAEPAGPVASVEAVAVVQRAKVADPRGDQLERLGERGGLGSMIVALVKPGRALVLRGGMPMGDTPPPYDFTRAFVVCERADETSRLVVEPVEAISFVMSRRMLHGIKQRAQRAARPLPA